MSRLQAVCRILYMCQDLLREALRFLGLLVSAKASLAAEVLFLRKQLAFYQERKCFSSAEMGQFEAGR
jgi:hypothetical protein